MTRKIIKIETPQQKFEAHKYLIALGFTNVYKSGFSYPCFLVTDNDQSGFREWSNGWYNDQDVNYSIEELRASVEGCVHHPKKCCACLLEEIDAEYLSDISDEEKHLNAALLSINEVS